MKKLILVLSSVFLVSGCAVFVPASSTVVTKRVVYSHNHHDEIIVRERVYTPAPAIVFTPRFSNRIVIKRSHSHGHYHSHPRTHKKYKKYKKYKRRR